MKFKMKVSSIPGNGYWWEVETEDTDNAEACAKAMIKRFNRTRRPGEFRRTLHEVVVLDKDAIEKHDWNKTNLVTKRDRTGMYDSMECMRCRITGKRYGLGQHGVVRDRKYSAGKYKWCRK